MYCCGYEFFHVAALVTCHLFGKQTNHLSNFLQRSELDATIWKQVTAIEDGTALPSFYPNVSLLFLMNSQSQHWLLPSVRFKSTSVFFYCRLDVALTISPSLCFPVIAPTHSGPAPAPPRSLPMPMPALTSRGRLHLLTMAPFCDIRHQVPVLVGPMWPFAQCISLGVYLKVLFSIAHQVFQILC